ncbi:MAG TPA: RecQ family zinc-binding domain-containing protein, partial [Bacteroidales bacterium]|nr:RecQ family zinc-binding domain-containing protein [Bacteroidales bacterium]
ISYYKAKQNPVIFYSEERVPQDNIYINRENYEARKERQGVRLDAMIQYITTQSKCRSLQLLEYFGETNKQRCGNCDSCRKRNELQLTKTQFDGILEQVKKIVQKESKAAHEIVQSIDAAEEDVLKVINYLLDYKKIVYTNAGQLMWRVK